MTSPMRFLLAVIVLAIGAGCDGRQETAVAPAPEEYGGDATGYFCQMLLAEHGGPKGQVHLASRSEPLWFSSVRDTVAFTLLDGESKDVTAIYVNDMGRVTDWAAPQPGTWVKLADAWLVIESRRLGGMGLPEVVPFGTSAAADSFASDNGGRVVRLAEVPADYVLGMPQLPAEATSHATH